MIGRICATLRNGRVGGGSRSLARAGAVLESRRPRACLRVAGLPVWYSFQARVAARLGSSRRRGRSEL